jgi:DNA-binding NarL/FixJ family response regulator
MRVLLEMEPDIQVVGEAVDVKELFAQVEAMRPDLVLLDWELPGLTENGELAALGKLWPSLSVFALSTRPGARQRALAAGVDEFVSKIEPPNRLLEAIAAGLAKEKAGGSQQCVRV